MRLTVIGSINLDFVASAPRLPRAGETVTGATLARHPGGKGANQALAAQRLGAEVCLIGRVGRDGMAEEAMGLLLAEDVDVAGVITDAAAPTGVALIAVDPQGENQIVVAAGANHSVMPEQLPARIETPLILQLELPVETVEAAVGRATEFVCVNLAPAAPVSDQLLRRADLLVVNETEAEFYGDLLHHGGGRVVVTLGARGAVMYQRGAEVARATPPRIRPLDATGAGDAFVGAICVALLEGMAAEPALRFACAAGAVAATRAGAQPSLPTRAEVEAIITAT
ncbi:MULTISPECIES: ribokinase [unclassified Brevundimonas]|uniref:ribokinase n=1 Tax=unclassified Brevundimonas TaxID=2622653 RepID=UPI0006F601FB|nr:MULTISPECIES: ribokinase [unclassified Brevundimonas]KQY88066.1 ribokinase [Brevundimonas sp. Root1423]KRA28635.1 ribokinase [Brevundimonas sp. Root608]